MTTFRAIFGNKYDNPLIMRLPKPCTSHRRTVRKAGSPTVRCLDCAATWTEKLVKP